MSRDRLVGATARTDARSWLTLVGAAAVMAFFVGALFTFVITPLTGDIRIFLAGAEQTRYYGSFPANVLRSWEINFTGDRFLYYFVYHSAAVLVGVDHVVAFERVTKGLFALTVVSVSWWAAPVLASACRPLQRVSRGLVAAGLATTLLTVSYDVALQAEWISNVIVLASLPLAFSSRRSRQYAAGALLSLLFPLKGITVVMSLFVLLPLIERDGRWSQPVSRVAGALVLSTVGIIVLLAVVDPGEFQSLRSATVMERSFALTEIDGGMRAQIAGRLTDLHVPAAVSRLVVATAATVLDRGRTTLRSLVFNAIPNIPVLAAGLLAFGLALTSALWCGRFVRAAALSVCWVGGLMMVGLEGRFFPYHYAVLILPALWSLIWLGEEIVETLRTNAQLGPLRPFRVAVLATGLISLAILLRPLGVAFPAVWAVTAIPLLAAMFDSNVDRRLKLTAMCGLCLPIWLFSISPVSRHYSQWAAAMASERMDYGSLDARWRLDHEPLILYLDDGVAPYYIQARSASRYFYPVVIQRGISNPDAREMEMYRTLMSQILAYRGRFIILNTDYIPPAAVPRLFEKLSTEYVMVDSAEYCKPHNYPLGHAISIHAHLVLLEDVADARQDWARSAGDKTGSIAPIPRGLIF